MALYLFDPLLLPSVAVSRSPFQCIAKTGRKCRDESIAVGEGGLAIFSCFPEAKDATHPRRQPRRMQAEHTHSSTRSAQRNGVQWGDIAGCVEAGGPSQG